MKNILLLILFTSFIASCNQPKVGFLKADNAEYLIDTLIVHRTLDPERSYVELNMFETGAEWWASDPISGVLGTDPVMYAVAGVKASNGGDAALFEKEVRVIGGGRFYYPCKDIKAPNGTYLISIRVSNDEHSVELKDMFWIIIED